MVLPQNHVFLLHLAIYPFSQHSSMVGAFKAPPNQCSFKPKSHYLVGGSCRTLIVRGEGLDMVGGGSAASGLVFSSVSHDGTASTNDGCDFLERDVSGESRLKAFGLLHNGLFGCSLA